MMSIVTIGEESFAAYVSTPRLTLLSNKSDGDAFQTCLGLAAPLYLFELQSPPTRLVAASRILL